MDATAISNATAILIAKKSDQETEIGHGILVADDLLLTCAHVVGDAEADSPPFAQQIDVRFFGGAKAIGILHDRGWMPRVDKPPLLPADLALLKLTWEEKCPPKDLVPVSLHSDWPDDVEYCLFVTRTHGKLPQWLSNRFSKRPFTSPRMVFKSARAPENEVLEFGPDDTWNPSTEKGWSGAPVLAKSPQGEAWVVGLWNGAPERSAHIGQATSARVVDEAIRHCQSPAPIWTSQPWKPHPFRDDVRRRQRHLLENGNPVTGAATLTDPTAMKEDDQAGIFVETGISGVFRMRFPDAGAVDFGITSARLRVTTFHLRVHPPNIIDVDGARATAELERMPDGGATQSVEYLLQPRKVGDVLMGNTLAGAEGGPVRVAGVDAAFRPNHPPELQASLTPEFNVIDVDEMDRPQTEGEVRAFKMHLIEELMRVHRVDNGEVPLAAPRDD